MKATAFILFVLPVFLLLQSCTSTRRFGTTIERDENNPCQINIIIQVAVEGTADDVKTVRQALEDCYNKECFIPCPDDSTKGCLTKTKIVVKSYGELKEEERDAFHYAYMIDDDGLPSNAYLGTPNHGASSGTWRRGQPASVYCHEVLHFCGLDDKYCSRLFDPVTNQTTTELVCKPPPDPGNGSCCTTFWNGRRCSTPCEGHEHNLMATTSAALSCGNVLDIVKAAGLNSCPAECCASDKTFARPLPEYYITPGFYNFGDKNTKFGSLGVSIGGTRYLGGSLGVTIDAGIYNKTEKEGGFKQSNNMINITGGVNYKLEDPFKISDKTSVNLQGRAGVSLWNQKSTFNNNTIKNTEQSLLLNVGAALDWKLNRNWSVRILDLLYSPTFFYDAVQHNFRIGAGVVWKVGSGSGQ